MIKITDENKNDIIASCLIEAASVLKTLDSNTEVLEEGIILNLKNKLLNKKTEKKIVSSDPKMKELTQDNIVELRKIVGTIFNKMYSYINKNKSDITNCFSSIIDKKLQVYDLSDKDKEDRTKNALKTKLECKNFEEGIYSSNGKKYGYDLIIEVLDGDQDSRILLSDVVYRLASELETIVNEELKSTSYKYDVDTGDGDEGCLYLNICKK